MEMRDLRTSERFIADSPLVGIFGAAPINVIDLSSQGVQIEHAAPLRLGMKGRLSFQFDSGSVNAYGTSVWSRLSRTPNDQGKYLYRTGVHIDAGVDEFGNALQSLIDHNTVHADKDSMARKQQRVEDRQTERKSVIKVIRTSHDIPADQMLLVQHARERLRANPEEALKWYNRVKFALADITDPIPNREEVLAVWEYLERTIEVSTIVQVFEKLRLHPPKEM